MSSFTILKSIVTGLIKGPVTHRYPGVPAKNTPLTRGHLESVIDNCIFCGLCSMHCPSDSITVNKAERTWALNQFSCVTCGNCVDYCPKECLQIVVPYISPQMKPIYINLKGSLPEKKE